MMDDPLRQHLIVEIIKDLDENPEDAWHIINGLKEGYPDDASGIAQEILWRIQDRSLVDSLLLQQSLKEMREGKTVEL